MAGGDICFNGPTSSMKSSEYEENISCFPTILNIKEEQNAKLVKMFIWQNYLAKKSNYMYSYRFYFTMRKKHRK